MRHINYRHALLVVGVFLLSSVITLWSWNTLSELLSLPPAQYRHALAALLLLLIARWALLPGYRGAGSEKGAGYEHSHH